MRVAIVGSGVIGLSTAVTLHTARQRAGAADITLFTDRDLSATCSARAGAVFSAFDCADPDLVGESFRAFAALAGEPRSGVRMARSRSYSAAPTPPPPWAQALGAWPLPPTGPYAAGFEVLVPHIDMTSYLPWLAADVQRRGVTIVRRQIASFGVLFDEGYDAVINCAGLGARELAGDETVRPVRGQVLHVSNTLGLNDSIDAHEPGGAVTYIYPHPAYIVLGGTFEEDCWDEVVDRQTLDQIASRCRDLLRAVGHPRWCDLSGMDQAIRAVAGLRPARFGGLPGGGRTLEAIRLETVPRADGRFLVHNYGHGRCGVTLSWGCAAAAARMLV